MISMAGPALWLCRAMPEGGFQSPDPVSHSPCLQIQASYEDEYAQMWDKLLEEVLSWYIQSLPFPRASLLSKTPLCIWIWAPHISPAPLAGTRCQAVRKHCLILPCLERTIVIFSCYLLGKQWILDNKGWRDPVCKYCVVAAWKIMCVAAEFTKGKNFETF